MSPDPPARTVRTPSPLDAILPLVTLAVLIAGSPALFGLDALDGPVQVTLVLCAMVAALIGTWNMSGTIPTLVYYGIQLLSPTWYFAACALTCALISLSIGSSWTTAGTIGVGLVGIASMLGVDVHRHIRRQAWTSVPAFVVAFVVPTRVFRAEFARRDLAPANLSRLAADCGTVTSPLVPWNSCGAYMAAVLGVSTLLYLPYCVFNIASPLLSVAYGITGFTVERTTPEDSTAATATDDVRKEPP